MKKTKGFTLVELLVVIAVIALLMSVLMPALRMARDQAMRIVCGSRIGQITKGMMIYADENQNSIPEGGGWWPWDVSYRATNLLLNSMGKNTDNFDTASGADLPAQKDFYCPSNVSQKRFRDEAWGFTIDPVNKRGYRVLGFAFLWRSGWNQNGTKVIMDEDGNKSDKRFIDRIDVKRPAESELVIDVVLRDPGTNNYMNVSVGGMDSQGINDTTSHLRTPSKPMGGNIGFVDGHIEWRRFEDMVYRFSTGPEWLY